MAQPKMHHEFAIIGRNVENATWTGTPTTINPKSGLLLPQTTNGSMIFTALNLATVNNQGQITLTSGGGAPQFLTIPALANAPTVEVKNWGANNLGVTNVSVATATPISVSAVGPGLPGLTPGKLTTDGTSIALLPYGATGVTAVQGNALPQYMQLSLTANNSGLTIFGVVGGPPDGSGNNAYVIQLNAASNTGPSAGPAGPPPTTPAPAGYYATVTGNTYGFNFNWGSSLVFVVNISPATASGANVSLYSL